MQKICIILILLFTSACTHNQYETVQILGKNQTNATLIRGMGVRGSDGSILTSSHVVRDDNLSYMVEGKKYMVVKRDIPTDRAILSQYVVSGGYTEDIWQLQPIYVGDPIYTEVLRSKKLTRLRGKIQNPNGSVLGYDSLGRTMTLSGVIITDLELLPGDSGAPIFNRDGELVDVVHVK